MSEKPKVTIVEAPEIQMKEGDNHGDAILRFYDALGWDRIDNLDPTKIRTSPEIADEIFDKMLRTLSEEQRNGPEREAVAMLFVNSAPSCDNDLTGRQVRLIQGWRTPPAKTT